MSEKKTTVIEIKFKDLNGVNFESQELIQEFEEIKKGNEQLIESTKIDTESLSKKFEI